MTAEGEQGERIQILVVGSVNLDVVVRVSHLPRPGETVIGSAADRHPGGKGANQAVAASRLGARVRMLGAVGSDETGMQLIDLLRAEQVDVGYVQRIPATLSGMATICVRPDGENTIVLSPGANLLLETGPDVTAVLGDADVVLMQLETPVAANLAVAAAARARGTLVALNAAPLPQKRQPLGELLAAVDVLVVNEHECRGLLSDPMPPGEAGHEAWLHAARALQRHGPAVVVVSLGHRGAVGVGPSEAASVDAFPVDAVDAVGAGDAFCAAVTLALAAGRPLADALLQGCAAGACATLVFGAQGALPSRRQVDTLLAMRSTATGGPE